MLAAGMLQCLIPTCRACVFCLFPPIPLFGPAGGEGTIPPSRPAFRQAAVLAPGRTGGGCAVSASEASLH